MNNPAFKENIYLERISKVGLLIGNTPLYPINRIQNNPTVKIFAKLEWFQIGGSVKARAAYEIINDALIKGHLGGGRELLDATSGNTGIAYASICGSIGIPLTIVLPENASKERRLTLQALGASLIFTSKFDGTDGAQAKAAELAEAHPDKYYYVDQYSNPANWKAHFNSTAKEIFNQTNGELTHFISGLGTTGTFTGTTRGLKKLSNSAKFISLQPETALHGLEGWKHLETARVPRFYDALLADSNYEISTGDAYEMIKAVSAKEGLLLSPSSAANLVGAVKVAQQIESGVIVTVFPDNAEKYSEVLNKLF